MPDRHQWTIIALWLCMPLIANAAILERDFRNLGDGLLTYDNIHQKEWLDLSETLDWTIAELTTAIAMDGPLQGISVANAEEVTALANASGVQWLPANFLPLTEWPQGNAADNLIDLVGPILDYSSNIAHINCSGDICEIDILEALAARISAGYALYEEENSVSFRISSVISVGDDAPGTSILEALPQRGGILFDYPKAAGQVTGPFWLVRNAIPEPSTTALLSAGLILWLSRNATEKILRLPAIPSKLMSAPKLQR